LSKKSGLDQYYTCSEEATLCISEIKEKVEEDRRQIVVEPSAGEGVFLGDFKKIIALDVDPKHKEIQKQDFFDTDQESLGLSNRSRVTVYGNPPFGKNGNLAVQFFNHAATMATTVAFILPRSFQKGSVQNKLNLRFHLVYERVLGKERFILNGKRHDVPCVFQIWRSDGRGKRKIRVFSTPDFSFVKKSNLKAEGFCIRRVGGRAGKVLKGTDHSETSTYFIQPNVPNVKRILGEIDFSETVVKTAGVRSLSQGELISAYINRTVRTEAQKEAWKNTASRAAQVKEFRQQTTRRIYDEDKE